MASHFGRTAARRVKRGRQNSNYASLSLKTLTLPWPVSQSEGKELFSLPARDRRRVKSQLQLPLIRQVG